MNRLPAPDFLSRTCANCGKEFIIHSPEDYAYKRYQSRSMIAFCSWHCMRENERNRGSKAQRREKIIQAIYDGLSNAEIFKMLGEEPGKVDYWRKKLREENGDDRP